jgi:hypothetical protein
LAKSFRTPKDEQAKTDGKNRLYRASENLFHGIAHLSIKTTK